MPIEMKDPLTGASIFVPTEEEKRKVAENKKSVEDLNRLKGVDDFTTVIIKENDEIIGVETKNGGNLVESSYITYNVDGTVDTVLDKIDNKYVTTKLHYNNGEFTHITKVVS